MHGLGGALALGKQEKGKEEMEWRSGKHPVLFVILEVCYLLEMFVHLFTAHGRLFG